MLTFLLFSIISCQNILKNPSFEEVDSNNKILYWSIDKEVEISSECYSGKKCLHWKMANRQINNYQMIQVDKGFQYEVYVHIKIVNLPRFGVGFCIESVTHTFGFYEYYRSRGFYGDFDWKKICL